MMTKASGTKERARRPAPVQKCVKLSSDIQRLIEEQQKDEWIKRLWSIARGDEDVGHYSVREKQDALHIGKVAGVIVKGRPG